MKVKVIKNGEIIDVEFSHVLSRGGEQEKVYRDTFTGKSYLASELEKVNNNKVQHIRTGVIETVIGDCKIKMNGVWVDGVIYQGNDRFTGKLTTFVRERSDFEKEFKVL